jgi:hypothetical protein
MTISTTKDHEAQDTYNLRVAWQEFSGLQHFGSELPVAYWILPKLQCSFGETAIIRRTRRT